MGLAPTPGTTPNANANNKRVAMRIKQGDDVWELNIDDLGPQDDIVCRKATMLPVTPFFEAERFGSDSLLILLWFARRKSGEPNLTWDEVVSQYPNYAAIAEANFDIETDEEVAEGVGDESDPLPSDAT